MLDGLLRRMLGRHVDELDAAPADAREDLDLLAGGESFRPVEDVTVVDVALLGERAGDASDVVGIDGDRDARTGRIDDLVVYSDSLGPRLRVRHECGIRS